MNSRKYITNALTPLRKPYFHLKKDKINLTFLIVMKY